MDEDYKSSRLSVIIHTAVAIVAGFVSFQLPRALFGIIAGIAILIATGFAVEKIVKNKDIKWWLGNGIIIYLFFWIITWTILFNLYP